MRYFYDYFAKEYREHRRYKHTTDRLYPADLLQGIEPEAISRCRIALRSKFRGYRAGADKEPLKMLLGEYREYVYRCHDEIRKDCYNAFVYHFMVDAPVGVKAIGGKFGVAKETIHNYINRTLDEILILCMGIAAVELKGTGEDYVRSLIEYNRIFQRLAGDYVLEIFPEDKERETVERSRHITGLILRQISAAVEAYIGYCNDEHMRIDTDIRKSEVLRKCLEGVPLAAIAERYGCSESTVYSDIRENEKRLAAMLFDIE